jgi:hypothetical protein
MGGHHRLKASTKPARTKMLVYGKTEFSDRNDVRSAIRVVRLNNGLRTALSTLCLQERPPVVIEQCCFSG